MRIGEPAVIPANTVGGTDVLIDIAVTDVQLTFANPYLAAVSVTAGPVLDCN